MDIRKIKKLIELVEQSGITELEIKEGEESVRISRHSVGAAATAQIAPAAPAVATPTAPPVETVAADTLPVGQEFIESPMVGTFYAKPAPDEPPFVKIGEQIAEGDTLCIIEAMKIMNHITAEKNGKIIAIECQDGESVEFGTPLFVIEP